MSGREKKMLYLLGIIIVIGAAYFLGYAPFTERVQAMESNVSAMRASHEEGNARIAKTAGYRSEIENKTALMNASIDNFYVDPHEEEYIVRIHRLGALCDIVFDSISLSGEQALVVDNTREESLGRAYVFSINYNTSYYKLMRLLELLNSNREHIVCGQLAINHSGPDGQIVEHEEYEASPQEEAVLEAIRGITDIDAVELKPWALFLEENKPDIDPDAGTFMNVSGSLELMFCYMTGIEDKKSPPPSILEHDPLPTTHDVMEPFIKIIP